MLQSSTTKEAYKSLSMTINTRGQGSHLDIETNTSVPTLIPIESLKMCEYIRACLDPQLKLQLDCFYSYLITVPNKSKCNEPILL